MKYSLRSLMSERAKTIVFWVVFVVLFVASVVIGVYCDRKMELDKVFP